jgi:thiol-disulfide isomerase/thioredoxin
MSNKIGKLSKRVVLAPCLLALLFMTSMVYAQEVSQCTVTDKVADLNFTLQDVNGVDVLLSDYAGKVILLDFWATWCAPCRIEIPGFIEFNDKYADEGFAVLGISVDDPVDSLLIYIEDMEMDYPVLIGDGRDDIKDSYGPLYGFPSTFLIARDGSICHQHTGFSPQEQFEQEIEAML